MSTTSQTIRLYWEHALRYKRFLVPLLVIVPINVVVSDFLRPLITAEILQRISQANYNPNDLWGSFGTQIVLYALAVLGSGVAGWRLAVWLVWHLELRVLRDLAQHVFNHLLKMSPAFHANHFGGSLVSQTNKLVGAYVRMADATIFNLYTLVTAMTAAIVILAGRAPLYTLVLTILSVVYIVGTIRLSRPVRDANRDEATAQSKQTGQLADTITNIMAVKSFARGEHEQQRYWKAASHSRDMGLQSMRKTTVRETYSSIITSSISIAAIIIAVLGAGVFDADVATIFLIVTFTANLGSRLWEFQNVLRQYNRSLGDASDMVKTLQIEPEIKDIAQPEPSRISDGAIAFSGVTFTHAESATPLFEKINIYLQPGEKVGLVGHSGSGKTTLVRLLMRYIDIDSGTIAIDGQNICSITQDDLRQSIAYVPQEPLLFHRSIRENIAYGKPDATQAEIEQITKAANAHDFIVGLPKGYDTLVGERGVKLSGGQRQRIAIARAMIKDAPILVLDEATSALDSESEQLIQESLWKLMEGRTAIVIAHRLSTIQKMDRIIVLDNGTIAEEGPHKELLAANGIYAKLWAHQSGGFIEE